MFGAAWQVQAQTAVNAADAFVIEGVALQRQALDDLPEAGILATSRASDGSLIAAVTASRRSSVTNPFFNEFLYRLMGEAEVGKHPLQASVLLLRVLHSRNDETLQ